jgi:hypothetical protein
VRRQIHNEGKSDQTDDADGRALSVDCDCCEQAEKEGDDGHDDGCNGHRLRFYFESEFHPGSQRRWGRLITGLEGERK